MPIVAAHWSGRITGMAGALLPEQANRALTACRRLCPRAGDSAERRHHAFADQANRIIRIFVYSQADIRQARCLESPQPVNFMIQVID
jgi:hypothetical protein